jgi:hypothetical protein
MCVRYRFWGGEHMRVVGRNTKKIFKRERKQIELEFFHNSAKTFLNKQIIEAEVDDVVEE